MFPYTPTDPGRIPVTLGAQFKRHAGRFSVGLLLLALYQVAQWWFDNHFMSAINAATSGKDALALDLGVLLVAVALGAFVARVLSRLVVFNAGRIAEYELRRALLHRLQRLVLLGQDHVTVLVRPGGFHQLGGPAVAATLRTRKPAGIEELSERLRNTPPTYDGWELLNTSDVARAFQPHPPDCRTPGRPCCSRQ